MKELLLFQVGTIQFGIDLTFISSIEPMKEVFVEQSENSHRTTQILDGRETELYDLSFLFEVEGRSGASDSRKLILVEVNGSPVGITVDRVDRVVSVDNNRIEPLSSIFKGPSRVCFPGVLKHEDRLVLLLNPEGIVNIDRLRPEFAGSVAKTPDRKEYQAASQSFFQEACLGERRGNA